MIIHIGVVCLTTGWTSQTEYQQEESQTIYHQIKGCGGCVQATGEVAFIRYVTITHTPCNDAPHRFMCSVWSSVWAAGSYTAGLFSLYDQPLVRINQSYWAPTHRATNRQRHSVCSHHVALYCWLAYDPSFTIISFATSLKCFNDNLITVGDPTTVVNWMQGITPSGCTSMLEAIKVILLYLSLVSSFELICRLLQWYKMWKPSCWYLMATRWEIRYGIILHHML